MRLLSFKAISLRGEINPDAKVYLLLMLLLVVVTQLARVAVRDCAERWAGHCLLSSRKHLVPHRIMLQLTDEALR